MIIQHNADLRPLNTFGIQASARYLVTIRSEEDIASLLSSREFNEGDHLVLGGGSNMLFTGDYPGLVARMEIKGIEIKDETADHVTLFAGAGENWHELVMFTVSRDYGGLENLSLIPGTVGAAPMQNIGAYGVEIKDVIQTVDAVHKRTGIQKQFSRAECAFGYRESIFKQQVRDQYIITGVTLRLTRRNHALHVQYGAIQDTLRSMTVTSPTIRDVSEAVIRIRQSKLPDPSVIGNAGSFFKNPSVGVDVFMSLKEKYPAIPSFPSAEGQIKIPAGWLIEQCGWKGKRIGNIGVHAQQALVLVNYGGGAGKQIWNLAMEIRQSVMDQFNVLLQPEVNVVM